MAPTQATHPNAIRPFDARRYYRFGAQPALPVLPPRPPSKAANRAPRTPPGAWP